MAEGSVDDLWWYCEAFGLQKNFYEMLVTNEITSVDELLLLDDDLMQELMENMKKLKIEFGTKFKFKKMFEFIKERGNISDTPLTSKSNTTTSTNVAKSTSEPPIISNINSTTKGNMEDSIIQKKNESEEDDEKALFVNKTNDFSKKDAKDTTPKDNDDGKENETKEEKGDESKEEKVDERQLVPINDNGWSIGVLEKIARKSKAGIVSVGAVGGALAQASAQTTVNVAKEVTTTTMKQVLTRHDVIKWGFIHHHYYTTSTVPVTTTSQVTTAVAISKGVIIGKAAIGSGIATAVVFGLELAWNAGQLWRGKITLEEFKRRTVKSAITNGSVLAASVGGAAIGTAIAPGVGTLVGGIIGSVVGLVAGLIGQNQYDKSMQKLEVKNKKLMIEQAASHFAFMDKDLKDKETFNKRSVKRKFKLLVRENHPDYYGSHEKFVEFFAHYKILLDYCEELGFL